MQWHTHQIKMLQNWLIAKTYFTLQKKYRMELYHDIIIVSAKSNVSP